MYSWSSMPIHRCAYIDIHYTQREIFKTQNVSYAHTCIYWREREIQNIKSFNFECFSLTGIILRFWNHSSVKNKCFLQMRHLQPGSGKYMLTQYIQHAIK